MVETRWSLRGTHGEPREGVPPTGKQVYTEGQLLSRIVDGKFVEEWVHWDTLGLLRQIGAVAAGPGSRRLSEIRALGANRRPTPTGNSVKPRGLREHTYWLTSPDFELILGRSEKFPPALVQMHSGYMHSVGIGRALNLTEGLVRHEVEDVPFVVEDSGRPSGP